MENLIYLLITTVIILLVVIAITSLTIRKLNKLYQKFDIVYLIEDDIKNTILNTNFFSEEVLKIYKLFKTNPNLIKLEYRVLNYGNPNAKVWAANEAMNREFYGKDVDELNKQLTYYDKILLDKLVKYYKFHQKEIVNKIFIKD